ncbi:MAG TPA: serine/threonine-protein kinase [Polyangiaceae bacterium]
MSATDTAVELGNREPSDSQAPGAWQPGELFGGKYRVDTKLAEGGMGVVLRATHVDLGSPVAIKVIRAEHAANQDVVARLMDEARIAASLRSKHVNRVVDFGRTDAGLAYLVLEYMEGRDLAQHLQERVRFHTTDAVDCVMQACEGLAEAHGAGIVHRDLKPENLFLSQEADDELVVKVLDFGISKGPAIRSAGRSLTSAWEVVGSPHYMAPEQVRRQKVDARTDVWGLGVILYELCSGRTPFEADTLAGIFERIVDEARAPAGLPVVEVPQGLQAVIQRCLERSPEKRFQTVVELAEALAPFGSDPLQAERVAKVAAATSSRLLGGRNTGVHGSGAVLPAGTPLGLATTRRSSLPTPVPRSNNRLLAVLALCAVAGLALAFAIGQLSTRTMVAASQPLPTIAAAAPQSPPAPPVRSVQPAEAPAAAAASAAPARRVVRGAARPARSFAAAHLTRTDALPAAPPSAARDTAQAPPPNDSAGPKDPWNPKSYGGRR